jgi:hypothetical protein
MLLQGYNTVDLLLPVRCPSNGYLLLVSWNTIEELTSVVVFAEVRDPSCCIERHKVRSIELAREVLRDTASQRSTRVDRQLQQPHGIIGSLHWHLDKVWAFVLQTEKTDVAQVGSMSPVFQVLGGVESKGQVDCVRENHDPLLGWRVPYDLGIPELGGVGRNDRVVLVSFEGVTTISAVGYGLLLRALHASWIFSEGVNGYNTVILIGEEARGVVRIDDGRPGEDERVVVRSPQSDFLVLPVVQVGRGLCGCQHQSQVATSERYSQHDPSADCQQRYP